MAELNTSEKENHILAAALQTVSHLEVGKSPKSEHNICSILSCLDQIQKKM